MTRKNIFLLLFGALLLGSCSQEKLPAPFGEAQWIGTGERALYADHLPIFTISADISFEAGSSRASLLFGGNDPRLMDRNLNILGVENGKDESYVRIELTGGETAQVNVYRTGYTREDTPEKVLTSLAVPDSLLGAEPYRLSAKVSYNTMEIALGGTTLGKVDVGPIGSTPDYIAFPQLADVGWLVEDGQHARVYNIEVRETNKPCAQLWQHPGMEEASTGVMQLCEPSHGGMPVLRSRFSLKDKEIASATLYATARGIYELELNGERVGEDYLAPGLSQYNKHHYYQRYDVKEQLRAGDNTILCQLAEGWWAGNITYSGCRNYFGDQLAFLGALELEYADGSKERFVTNPRTWEVTTNGPVVSASLFQGQVTDGSRSLDEAAWRPAEEMRLEGHTSDEVFRMEYFEPTAPRTDDYSEWQLLEQPDPSPRCYEMLTAKSVTEVRPGVFVYDMGQNFAGIPSIRLRGLRRGQAVRFRYAEVLYPELPEYRGQEGMLMLENLRGAMVQDIYIAAGEEEELFEPHFTQHGYRYIEISGIDDAPRPEDVKGLVISSVQRLTAHYECSNPMVNRLWENICWSMIGNFISIPTDCPQRNERMGWSGDLSVFSRTATYLADVDDFLRRHAQAIRDVQLENGRMPDVAPIGGAFGGLLWGSVGITMPYECYRQYADTAILVDNYEAMSRYMTLIREQYVEPETGLMTQGNRMFGGLGDWLGPQNAQLDNTAVWDAYYIFDLRIMQEVAAVLGHEADAETCAQMLRQRKSAFVERYLDPTTGRFLASGYGSTQEGQEIHLMSSYVLPLAFDIIDDEPLREKVLHNLEETILHPGTSDNGILCPPYSLMTGFITTAWISEALSRNGRSDLAYRLLQQQTYPSWLYPVAQGATTIWERLDSYTRDRGFGGNNSMNSFNHYSFGAVGQWMMARSLGIARDPEAPGFRHFILCPESDPTGQMSWAEGWYDAPYGRIRSRWEREGNRTRYTFSIPEGCSATLRVAGLPEQELEAGEYQFVDKQSVNN